MELTVTPEVEALLRQGMETGRYQSPNDLIKIALDVLADSTPGDLEHLNESIQQGLDDIERGDVYTEEEARAYLRAARENL